MQIERISPGRGETNEASCARRNGLTVLRACSACAGDYEDPDRTVWTPDDGEDGERESAPRASTEEFPAEE